MAEQQIPVQNISYPVTSDEIYANYLQEERVRNVISQTSPDMQLMEIQWRIKGYIKDPVTGIWEKIDKDAKEPNPKMITRFVSYLSSILNDNTRFSNYGQPEINQIMKLIIEWISDDLDANSKEYGIDGDYTEMTRIGHIMLHTCFSVFKRSLNGQESKRVFDSVKLSEVSNQGLVQQKGWLDNLKFWK
jgi:hypothetical protein